MDVEAVMRKVLGSLGIGLLTVGWLSGCGSELSAGADHAGIDGVADAENTDFHAASARVGEKAEVTASSLNLRSGPGTSYAVIASMPKGTIVDVLSESSGFYRVTWGSYTGYCSGDYLVPYSAAGGVADAVSRAESGVGFSYWWGGGCWKPGSSDKGSCTGSCPGCTHGGSYGADCSGYVAKVWQVPGTSSVSTCSHPYSTYNFANETREWRTVARGSAKQGDAFVYNENGAGHIFMMDNGDPWGWMKAYEAKGCSYGIVHGSRTAGTSYKVIRRNGY
jgi:cell wall-associated NlpC family hydrolase